MTEHPITPPPELFKQWEGQPRSLAFEAAYRAGADMELKACCEWLTRRVTTFSAAAHLQAQRNSDELRTARRPKSPSLKEQALEILSDCNLTESHSAAGAYLMVSELKVIYNALEALPND
jgi:hypothetical protein